MYHIFIYSSVHGRLDYYHVLAIVNSSVINIGVHVSFQIRVFSRIIGLSESWRKNVVKKRWRSFMQERPACPKTQRWDSVVPLAVNSMWMKSGRKGKVKVVYSEQWWLVSHVPGKWHCHICASQTSQREIGLNGICKPVLTVLIWKHYSKKLTSIDVTRFPRDPWHKNGQEPLFDLVVLCWNGN